MTWEITYFSASVQSEILAMPAVFGPDLGMPHTRAMGQGLFELRIKGAEGVVRVFYCTVVGRRIVILHQFRKKSEKTPRKELDTALRRMKEVVDA
jgi:phage-related protein